MIEFEINILFLMLDYLHSNQKRILKMFDLAYNYSTYLKQLIAQFL